MQDTWPVRFYVARKVLDLRSGRDVNDVDFGGMVAKLLGKKAPYSSGSVSQWRSEEQIPPARVQLAIAEACGVDPGWLTYGAKSAAPTPPLLALIDVASAAEALPQPDRKPQARRTGHRGKTKEDYARGKRAAAKPGRKRA